MAPRSLRHYKMSGEWGRVAPDKRQPSLDLARFWGWLMGDRRRREGGGAEGRNLTDTLAEYNKILSEIFSETASLPDDDPRLQAFRVGWEEAWQ